MAFKIPVVNTCPVTQASRGVIFIDNQILAEMYRTVYDEDRTEWAILLLGDVEDGGLKVTITDFIVPTDQKRTGGNVELGEFVMVPRLVGVAHSHHTMGAFFSKTDRDELNPKFRVSIVISTKLDLSGKTKTNEKEISYGFSYQAEGKVTLPCGAIGIVPFSVEPLTPPDESWPVPTPYMQIPDSASLSGCIRRETAAEDNLYIQQRGICGCLGIPERKMGIFGEGEGVITEQLPKPHVGVVVHVGGGGGRKVYTYVAGQGLVAQGDEGEVKQVNPYNTGGYSSFGFSDRVPATMDEIKAETSFWEDFDNRYLRQAMGYSDGEDL